MYKYYCPKCNSDNLHIKETCEASTTFTQYNGYIDKSLSNMEFGKIYRLEGECIECKHTWTFRKAFQVTGILKQPEDF